MILVNVIYYNYYKSVTYYISNSYIHNKGDAIYF